LRNDVSAKAVSSATAPRLFHALAYSGQRLRNEMKIIFPEHLNSPRREGTLLKVRGAGVPGKPAHGKASHLISPTVAEYGSVVASFPADASDSAGDE